ncbi:MAG: CRTAC1 family protein [Polyangiaceae bacterium]|nr:CRTAC1 family protein [Polyangiaceae bacterium]
MLKLSVFGRGGRGESPGATGLHRPRFVLAHLLLVGGALAVACGDENIDVPGPGDPAEAGVPDATLSETGRPTADSRPPDRVDGGLVDTGDGGLVDTGDAAQTPRCRWPSNAALDTGTPPDISDAMPDVITEAGMDASDGSSDASADSAPTTAVVERVTESVAAGDGAFIHIDTQPNIAEVVVQIGGVEVTPYYVDTLELGGVYALPSGTPPGILEVSVSLIGQTAETDCVSVRVLEPIFVNVSESAGIDTLQVAPDVRSTVFGGMAVADVDGDGRLEIFLSNVAVPGRLLQNLGDTNGDGNPEYLDWAPNANLDRGGGVSFVDYDNDGDQDLYVGREGPDIMLQNRWVEDDVANFRDVTSVLGLGGVNNLTTGQTWGDYDGDGDLDLYVSTYSAPSATPELHRDRLYRNDGETFTFVNHLLGDPGVGTNIVGYAAVWVDYDMDGDLDLLASSDHETYWSEVYYRNPNRLWRNDGPHSSGAPELWQFTEVGMESGFGFYPDVKTDGMNAMGLAVGDVDFDGRPDVIMSNVGPNLLLYGRADSNADGIDEFFDPRVGESLLSGIRRMWFPWKPHSLGNKDSWRNIQITWGTSMFDYDNDGDLDFYFSSGSNFPVFEDTGLDEYPWGDDQPAPDALFRNDGDGEFSDVGGSVGVGDRRKSSANIVLDIDDDGWLDVLVFSPRGIPRLYRNRSAEFGNANHWLVVALTGNGTSSNRDAIGSVVSLTQPGGKTQTCYVTTRPSQGSSGIRDCHFGLGTETTISALTVRWPDGEVQALTGTTVDQKLTVTQAP